MPIKEWVKRKTTTENNIFRRVGRKSYSNSVTRASQKATDIEKSWRKRIEKKGLDLVIGDLQ